VWLAESVTDTLNDEFVADVGVPEIVPFDESVSPAGNDPAVRRQVYGEVPPIALRVVE
jgi:hypothetical protein